MQASFKYFYFFATIHSVFCGFEFDSEGKVIVTNGSSMKIGNFPALKTDLAQKLGEAFEKYIDDREDLDNSLQLFVVDPEGVSLAFTVRLDNAEGFGGEICNISMAGNKLKNGGHLISAIEGFTFKQISSFGQIKAELQPFGNMLPDKGLEDGIKHILGDVFKILKHHHHLVDEGTPVEFRACLTKGTNTRGGNLTGTYLVFGVFFNTKK